MAPYICTKFTEVDEDNLSETKIDLKKNSCQTFMIHSGRNHSSSINDHIRNPTKTLACSLVDIRSYRSERRQFHVKAPN